MTAAALLQAQRWPVLSSAVGVVEFSLLENSYEVCSWASTKTSAV